MVKNNRSIGTHAEQTACAFLVEHNCKIIQTNYRSRFGEIDIICKDGRFLVFCEVKYRQNCSKGYPEEAVNTGKQRRICKVADYYRLCHHISEFSPVRFDVICLLGQQINWYKDAFPYLYL